MAELLLTHPRQRVLDCEEVAGGVRLEVATGSVELDELPDRRTALRLCRLATRVLEVRLVVDGRLAVAADLTAIWHRVPHTRSVPVGAALALIAAGVPGYLTSRQAP